MRRKIRRLVARQLRRLARAEDGLVTVMAVIFIVMILGFAGLVWDIGRIFNVQSEMQAYADHVALAAAAELDGQGGAIPRAIQAAVGGAPGPLVTDDRSFGDPGDERPTLAVNRLVFLSALNADPTAAADPPFPSSPSWDPEDDVLCTWTAGASDCVADDDLEAAFVEVTTTDETMSYWLLPMLDFFDIGAAAAPTEGLGRARAVAGWKREVCRTPPIYMCNPYETNTVKTFEPIIGQQIRLRHQQSASGQQFPGGWSLLDVPTGHGPPECADLPLSNPHKIACVLAAVNPNTQCLAGLVNTRPGFAAPAPEGINVRFDFYATNGLRDLRNNANFAPSRNVTKGVKQSGASLNQRCNQQDPDIATAQTVPLPRDSCFASNSCGADADGDQRFGNGITATELEDYWSVNHPGETFPADPDPSDGVFTRYELYRYEIDNNLIPTMGGTGGEIGRRTAAGDEAAQRCSDIQGVDNPVIDRRELIVAVLNCLEQDLRGNRDDVPVLAFARLFITEPIDTPPGPNDLWIEMLGVAEPGDETGIVHDFPVLYR
jgi:Flp pilus assembly protein TadG